ncbi:uncharacterized protein Tco025E_10301, partial [Trypanosoma conorhini]
MDCEELLALIEQCYERTCRKRRALCWNISGDLCSNPTEVIDVIRNSMVGVEPPVTKGIQVAIFSLLVSGTIRSFRVDDPLGVLGSLLACRVFSTLRRFSEEEKHSFLLQRNILHALAEIKEWIRCFRRRDNLLDLKLPLKRMS